MSDVGHTPGPWATRRSHDGSGDIGITANGVSNVIAECFVAMRSHDERADQEAAANARLIVAAPDMLAALKAAHKWLVINDDRRSQSDMELVEAAIAKAEGRAP